MGGSNRRRQQRTSASRGTSQPAQQHEPKPAWREAFDSWGGYPVFGTLAIALVVVGVLIYANRAGSTTGKGNYQPIARTTVSGRLAGNPDAPVKIIEFADFQCPFCKQWTDTTEKPLIDEFVNKGTASIQFVSFAFIGEESKNAAAAAECAADQNRFWDYHDILYLRQGAENTGVFSTDNLKKFGAELRAQFSDFDTAKFNKCVDSGEKKAAVEAQTKQATGAGVKSTPSFLVNGAAISGVQPIETFRQAIQAAAGANK